MNSNFKLKWKSDFEKQVVHQNFERRGWTKTGDDDWNIFWASVGTVKNIFNPETGHRLGEMQLLNHYPNHYELTRKDLMVKNIKRYRKELEKENSPLAEKDENGRYIHLDIIPPTFILPGDYTLFAEEFKRNPNVVYIAKPAGGAQGKGIFLVDKLNLLKKWATSSKVPFQFQPPKEAYVISKYVYNPLLIGGRKFDMRIYVLVTSYRPLKAMLYNQGFGRFCTARYPTDDSEIDNMMAHLTNVHFQKNSDDYNDKHGWKWNTNDIRFYLEMTKGKVATDKCYEEINSIIYISLKSVQSVMINDKHCFEMYGYDILIDANLKPWLIEVNASPSLTTTTEVDKMLKMNLINDVFSVVVTPEWMEETSKHGANTCKEKTVGGFTVIIDESVQEDKGGKAAKKGAVASLWR